MGEVTVGGKARPRRASFSAKVLNVDGTVKYDLGVIAYTHRSWFKRLVYKWTGIAMT